MKKQLDFLVQYEVEFQGWQRRSSGKFTIFIWFFCASVDVGKTVKITLPSPPPRGGYVTKCYHAMSVRLFLVFFKIIISIMKSYPLTYFKVVFIYHIGVLRPLYINLNFLKKIIF